MTLPIEDEALLGTVGLPTQGILKIAGPSYQSARAVQEALQENHVNYDWQFTPHGGLHNHLSHAILASYSLGASDDLIRDLYELHSKAQLPMCPLKKRISFQNWTRWLGQDDYYSSYLVFFTEEIQRYGAAATIERYLFKLKEGKLLIRTVSGAIHPFIQMGHGVEFGLDALVAEGLAQACVHSPQTEALFPPGWPNHLPQANSPFASAFSHFKALKSPVSVFSSSKDSFTATMARLDPARPRHPRQGLSGFTILGHMQKDPRLAAGQAMQKDDFPRLGAALANRGDLIRAWCEEWVIDPEGGWQEICEKLEEVFWIATVLVGASSRPGYKPKMDFFLMHTLTSAIFLPGMLEVLSPASRIALLHSHFRVMIAYWISRGRPQLYIQEVLMAATAHPASPISVPWENGAIQRGIQRGGTEEAKVKEEALKKEQEKQEQEKLDQAAAKQGDEANRPRSGSNAESVVDVALDSPAQEKSQLSFDEADTTINGDAAKTPTRAMSPAPDEPAIKPDRKGKGRATSPAATWSAIVASVVDHTDEHVTKMIRSLAFAAQNFGMAPPGVFGSSLPGSAALDGTVFVRLAGMCLDCMGWEHEGQDAGQWDRSVLGFDEAWVDAETRSTAQATASSEDQQGTDLFKQRTDYPRKLDKGKGRAVEQDV